MHGWSGLAYGAGGLKHKPCGLVSGAAGLKRTTRGLEYGVAGLERRSGALVYGARGLCQNHLRKRVAFKCFGQEPQAQATRLRKGVLTELRKRRIEQGRRKHF